MYLLTSIHKKRWASCVLFSSSMLSATGRAYTMLHQNEWCYSEIILQSRHNGLITCTQLWQFPHRGSNQVPLVWMATSQFKFWNDSRNWVSLKGPGQIGLYELPTTISQSTLKYNLSLIMKWNMESVYISPICTTISPIHSAWETSIYHIHLLHHKTKNKTPVMSLFFFDLHLLFWLWSIFLHSL